MAATSFAYLRADSPSMSLVKKVAKSLLVIFVTCLAPSFHFGCAAVETRRLHAELDLQKVLNQRRVRTLDLAEEGKKLAEEYGQVVADAAIERIWNDLTAKAPLAKAADVFWLQDQPPRVQDLAWLIRYRKEWVK